jgi:ABC-2 type transport system ATP-binding protein
MKALVIENLSKTYSNGVHAVKNINLEIEEGDFFAFLGANGAGKTTTIGIITGLVNKTAGKISVFGHDLDSDINQVKKMIGVVPQEFNFNPFENVIDILVNQAGYFGVPRLEATARATEILEKLGLSDKKNLQARTLSGGMKRRLMIARALVHKPKFLILDEPTAGVDVELRHGMWDYLQKLNTEDGVTILLTTHYLEEVEQLCKNVAIIKDGEIVQKDTVRNLLNSLDKEIYSIETNDHKNISSISGYEIVSKEEGLLEVVLNKTQSLNKLFTEFDKLGIQVLSIRPKGNRMEELFLNTITK